jgi:hypothetical protein
VCVGGEPGALGRWHGFCPVEISTMRPNKRLSWEKIGKQVGWHRKAEGKPAIDYGFHLIVTKTPCANASRVGRLGGSGGEDLDTREALKVCSIKGVEPGNAISEHGGDELGIEDMTAGDRVLAKQCDPPINHI